MTKDADTSGLRKVRRRTVSEEIADQLRTLVLSGDLQPGDRLPTEQELCSTFGASRVAVREALKLLKGAGLVETKPGAAGGIQVASPSPKQFRDAFAAFCELERVPLQGLVEFRIELERVAAQWAAERATPEDIQHLRRILHEMGDPDTKLERFQQLDVDFHTSVAETSKNEVFALVMNSVRHTMQRGILEAYEHIDDVAGVNRRIVEEHSKVVDLIEQGDLVAAGESLSRHVYMFYKFAFKDLELHPWTSQAD